MKLNEDTVEQAALIWFEELEYTKLYGPNIAEDGSNPERTGYSEVVLQQRLVSAIKRLNPRLPEDAHEEALLKILNPTHPTTILNNRAFHQMLVNGAEVQYQTQDGSQKSEPVKLIDFANIDNNDFVVCNQFTIIENNANRRPDRAEMRVRIKRLLRKHGYPPDKQEQATNTVLQQAELLCRDWVAA